MKPFENRTHVGNEKAIRKGRVVPEGDVNLAYVRAPDLSPKENVVVVDTSRITEENVASGTRNCKLYYANPVGVLQDIDDNIVISDEFPVVTDVFSVDEDFSLVPGNEYTDDSILPYRHVSRHFHLDHAGLTMGDDVINYEHDAIQVVDGQGNEYSNYRIKITPVYIHNFNEDNLTDIGSGNFPGSLWAYRVHAYVDTNENEDLYLTYNKIEVEDDTGILVRRRVGYRELLNPEPFFSYVPEESDVVDPANRGRKIYSSKPISYKKEILGEPTTNIDGYKIYVPKKAIPDPRLYQLFRWRVKCKFTQEVTFDPSRDAQTVNCGVIVTNKDLRNSTPSRAPYALLNLARSRYNASNVSFQNPAQPNHDPADKEDSEYWFVNIDTDDLSQYDLLIWAPNTEFFHYSHYAGKVNDFVRNHRGIVFIDTNTFSDPMDSLTGRASVPFQPVSGKERHPARFGAADVPARAYLPRWAAEDHPLVDGNAQLGGWDLKDPDNNNDPLYYMSYTQTEPRKYTQYFENDTGTPLIEVKPKYRNWWRTVTSLHQDGEGYKIFSTFGHLFTCNALFSYVDNSLVASNLGSQINSNREYLQHINSPGVEGAMKLLYNIALLAVRGRNLDSSDEEEFSTSWSYNTPWRSSWVISAGNGVLTDQEKSEHNFVIDARDIHAETPDTTPVWKRRLSDKTVRQLMDEAVAPLLKNPATRNRVEASARTYEIELTNPEVQVASKVIENDYPHAWTEAYTPRFTVPVELGPHIIKEEVDSSGKKGRVAAYDDLTYVKKEYPEKPYAGQVTAAYVATEEIAATETVNYVATASAVRTSTITESSPPREISSTRSTEVELSWWDSNVATRSRSTRGGPLDATGTQWFTEQDHPHRGWVKPHGIETWQNVNYYTNGWGPGHLNFAYWGMQSRLKRGSRGDVVKFVQDAFNRMGRAGYFSHSRLTVDGAYGPATEKAVRAFQTQMKARWVDGVIDAETFSLIGVQIHRMESRGKLGSYSTSSSSWERWYALARYVQLHRISDSSNTWFGKRSWRFSGPGTIWDMFAIKFRDTYKFHGLTLIPKLSGDADTLLFRSIHVTSDVSLKNYNSTSGQLTYMPHKPKSGREFYVPFGPYTGNTIIIGVGQDKSSGWGSSRMFGIQDIRAHARITETQSSTIPGTSSIRYQQEDVTLTVTGSVVVESFNDKVVQLQTPASQPEVFQTGPAPDDPNYTTESQIRGRIADIRANRGLPPDPASDNIWVERILSGRATIGDARTAISEKASQQDNLSNVWFTDITVDNPNVVASITHNGKATFSTQIVSSNSGAEIRKGTAFPGSTYYSMDENGRFNPVPETGWVSKADGIKLLCDNKKRPFGFPSLPTGVGSDEAQRHYVNLSLGSNGTDNAVQLGFYDYAQKEFIVSAQGKPEISFVEYLQRGPHNIYIAVISDYEKTEEKVIPVDEDAPRLPFKWAMPVYGVCTKAGSKITLASLPDRLGPRDLWPIAVREGQFTRDVDIRPRWEGGISGYLGSWQGKKVKAYYELPEAKLGGYSEKFGPPNIDVKNEEPLIIDDDALQVRQAPILMAQFPTRYPNKADPVRPVLTLYKRADRNSEWVEQSFSEIRDYNVSTGEIFLRQPLTSNDPSLLRVDYTTPRRSYHFKKDGDLLLNLNSYSGHTRDLIGEAIYVYIVPHFVRDAREGFANSGALIDGSLQHRTLRTTLDPGIFDPMHPQYDPLAILLGVVYISTALDISKLALLDTRRRGGGAKDSTNIKEITRLVNDAATYWDVGYATGSSYPKSGHVVVRLPDALRNELSEQEITDVIQRNIGAGVGFKIENLQGEDW